MALRKILTEPKKILRTKSLPEEISNGISTSIIFSALSASTYDLLDCQKLIFDLNGIEKLNNQLSLEK